MFAIVFNGILWDDSLNSGTRRHHHRASSLVNKKVEELLESFLYQNVIRSLRIQWANCIFILQYPETLQQATLQERLGNYLHFLAALWQNLRMGKDNMVTKTICFIMTILTMYLFTLRLSRLSNFWLDGNR